jgi:hypothetical protein
MIDTLFDTKEKRELAVANLRNLSNNAGWLLVVSILDANIAVLKDQILNGVENETKEVIDRTRDILKAYENFRNTPEMVIKQLTEGKLEMPVLDPFQTIEEFRGAKKPTA